MDTMAAYGLYNNDGGGGGGGGVGVPAGMYSDAAMTNLLNTIAMTNGPFMGVMPPTTVRCVAFRFHVLCSAMQCNSSLFISRSSTFHLLYYTRRKEALMYIHCIAALRFFHVCRYRVHTAVAVAATAVVRSSIQRIYPSEICLPSIQKILRTLKETRIDVG